MEAVMDMLNAMRVYVAVVESGSLVGASDGLNTSNAAVSRHIAALEAHLGARLLNRTTRRLSMTDAGQDFFARAHQILADVAEAEALAGESAVRPAGLLRISAPLSFGILRMSQWLPGFIARYPDLKLDVDLTDRVVDLANDGIDVAVRIARQPASTNVIARRIAPIPVVACAAPTYLARRGCPQVPEDLAAHDTLSFSYLSTGDNWTFRDAAGRETTIRIRPQVHATNGDILCELAVRGLGVIYQPSFIVERHIVSGALDPVLTGWTTGGLNLYALYLSRKFLSAKVRVFIDYLSEVESSG
jgi:DNA-binding transcriptional LysR family regulator